MLIVVSEPCCERKPFEKHKDNCYFKRERMETQRFIDSLLEEFKRGLKGGD